MALTKFRNSTISKKMPKYNALNTRVSKNLVFSFDGSDKGSYSGSGTSVFDLSGNSRTGTLINGVGFSTDASGCFTFNGTNQYINFPYTLTSPDTLSHTYSVWFNWDGSGGGTDGRRFLIESYDAAQLSPWHFSHWVQSAAQAGTSQKMQLSSTPYQNIVGNTTIEANRWYNFVAVTYRDTTFTGVTMYLNGLFDGNGTTILNNSTYKGFNVGSYRGTDGIADNRWFSGKISEMSIYDRALSREEVLQNFEYSRVRHGI
jgi:hypothetical protein